MFLLTKKALVTPLNTDGDRNLYQVGAPLGFNLLNDFSGLNYMYFGNFTALRPEVALWRLQILREILDGRRASLHTRVDVGIATLEQMRLFEDLLNRLQIWVVLSSEDDKVAVQAAMEHAPLGYKMQVFSIADIQSELAKLASPSA